MRKMIRLTMFMCLATAVTNLYAGPSEKRFEGEWVSHKNVDFGIHLQQKGDQLTGYHSAVTKDGSRTDMAGESAGVGADEALSRLLNGDKRFVAGKSEEPTGAALVERRHALAKDQKPFAVILGCSDSRVPPELIFDVTLGDIFVVRTAGE